MPTPKLLSLATFTLHSILLMSGSIYAQYFGARYVSEKESAFSEYYCLRTEDGRIYQRFMDSFRNAKKDKGSYALPMDSMIQIAVYDLQANSRSNFTYMFGPNNQVFITEDSIQRFFNGFDSTEVKRFSEDTLEMMRLSDAYSALFGEIPRVPIRQTVVFGDTTLPAIHPVNMEFPEVRYLPEVIIAKNNTWHLKEVFFDNDRIIDLLDIFYLPDFYPLTEADFDKMIRMQGMTKEEWWANIQKQAEAKQHKK